MMTRRLRLLAASLLLLVLPTSASAAMFFDGVNDFVSYPELGRLEAVDDTTALTICFSLQVHRVQTLSNIITQSTNLAANGWGIRSDTDHLDYIMDNQLLRATNGAPADGITRRYCFVWDGSGTGNIGRGRIYRNGTSITPTFSGTIPATITTTAVVTPICLGASGTACGTSPAAVYLSHVRIWIAALNSDEIALERFSYVPPVRLESLVLWAPLDEAQAMNYAGEGDPSQAPTVSGARLTADPNIEDPEIVAP